ncbi:MAG TPA: NAD(P)/FAD-dependent oxidoreductase [Nitrospinota bacterium]|nr:NAD(P)/FAD-dependent oxidoreductase [Nitrospinota bacterium]
MDKVDIAIIGAGVIGLAIAQRLSLSKEIVLIEQHDGFGRETSSRNSEIIHAGMYYPSDSLKARLCVEGNRKLYELCENFKIPYKKIGKLIIAHTEEEKKKIENLLKQGNKNGVPGLRLLNRQEINKMEPHILANLALFSPETGIFDSHQLMKFFEQKALSNNVTIAYNCTVSGLQKTGDTFTLDIIDADGESFNLESSIVVNSAGLHADKIASLAGIDVENDGYKLHFCKGEYFSVSSRHNGKLAHLVYPPPNTISLGIHTVTLLDGSLKLGPSAFYIDTIDYEVDGSHQKDFLESAKTYLPFIESNDLSPDMSGVRPKLQAEDEDFRDFVICEESNKGLKGLINLIGIESPGLTAAPAIADYVDKIVKDL